MKETSMFFAPDSKQLPQINGLIRKQRSLSILQRLAAAKSNLQRRLNHDLLTKSCYEVATMGVFFYFYI